MDEITIIGAGIGGLTTALGLLKVGRDVTIYEQAPELGEVGAGLSISPNAALGLEYLGMLDFMEKESNKPLWQYTHHGITNETLVAIDREPVRDQYGAAYFQIHRADFHAEIVRRIKQLKPDAIHVDHKLERVQATDDAYELHFQNNKTVKADALIGADGLKSLVRDNLFENDKPEFTGHTAWRALINADDLPDWYSEAASHVWIGPGKTFVCYPIRGKKLVNLVCFARANDWAEEGWAVKADRQEVSTAFDGWHDHVRELVNAIPEDTIYRWGLFAREPLDTLVNGKAALLGDAAHPMLPWFGQGASSSIEDGVVMARCFETDDSADDAFQKYNQARLERVTFLQRESNLGGERLQSLDPMSLKSQPAKHEDALGIFRYNPATVPL